MVCCRADDGAAEGESMAEVSIDWYRTPIDKALLRTLSERSDARGLLHVGGFLAIVASLGALAFWFFQREMWVAMVVSCYAYSLVFRFLSLHAAVHELSHRTVFRSKWLNESFYYLFSFLTWNNPIHFRISHRKHHQYTVHRGVDKEVVQRPVAEKLNWKNFLFWLTVDVPAILRFFGTNMLHAAGDGDADVFHWDPLFPPGSTERRRMIRWARLMLLGHLALGVFFGLMGWWVLIYLVSFGCFVGTWVSRLCVALQHTGLSENIPDRRIICYTVEFGPVMRFLYWNMNYHIEHHMYAAVPFYNLRRLHETLRHDYPKPLPGFLAGVRELLSVRAEQHRNPDYLYQPEFPNSAAPVKWS